MYRSLLPLRTLEILAQDSSNVQLRQCRAQAFYQQYRSFGTRACIRQADVATASTVDDGFIPFSLNNSPRTAHSEKWQAAPNGRQRRGDVRANQGREDGEWHAEIEIHSPPGLESNHEGFVLQAGGTASSTSGTVDGVRMPGLDATADDGDVRGPATPILHQELPGETNKAPATRNAQPLAGSRAASRLERKARRIAAGTFRNAAETSNEQKDLDSQMETVLAKLEAMEGPKTTATSNPAKAKQDDKKSAPQKPSSTKATLLSLKPKKESWQIQKSALSHKFGDAGWQPRKRLSPDSLEGIRALHASDPNAYTTETLSTHFKVTPEAIRRILKSKWKPSEEEVEDRRTRWERRGAKKWQDMAEKGMRAPAKWRAMGVGGGEGVQEERLPRRKRKGKGEQDSGLDWDEVVGGVGPINENLDERL